MEHFIKVLKGHVEVVRAVPEELMKSFNHSMNNIPNIKVHAWATVKHYIEDVHPILRQHGYESHPLFFGSFKHS